MNPNDVIESYVLDVMRRLPRKERNEIGLELRGLLTEMLAERAQTEGKVADDAMVLAMLRDFGMPVEVAARYRPAGMVIIPAAQTRSFALMSIMGVGLQWALTLPRVFEGQPLASWWLSWGLGSFWWPGLMVMFALVGAGLRKKGWLQSIWRPRVVDPDRINRAGTILGLAWFFIGVAFMISLPWIVRLMPDPVSQIFVFDSGFLHERAWPVLLLWSGVFAVRAMVFTQGRSSPLTRRLDLAFSLAFVALLVWWIAAGPIFQATPTNDGVKTALGLVIFFICMDLVYKLYRQRARIRIPKSVG